MLLLGYILVTCHKNNIVILHVTFMLYRRNKTCLLGGDYNEYNKQCSTTFMECHITKWLDIFHKLLTIGIVYRRPVNIITYKICSNFDFYSINLTQFLDLIKFWSGSGLHYENEWQKVMLCISKIPTNLVSCRNVFVKIKILIRIRIMISL